ncbi:acyl-CoA dehydrogenase family protein [Actinomadura madurae]|uniref:acyl-CoA dehydrogenase family protein n=1 Tax=Actinomadura madurae TaxID=1993 RepID=UPI003D6ADE91
MTSRFPTSGASATSTAAGRWRSICCSGSAACSPGCARPRCWACSASCRRGDGPGRGAAYQDVIALRLRSLGTLRALAAGRSDGPQVSIDKLLLSRAERSVHELAHRMRPVGVDDGTPGWRGRVHEYLHSRSAPIYGGSAEIQRTIIADQILQLREKAR